MRVHPVAKKCYLHIYIREINVFQSIDMTPENKTFKSNLNLIRDSKKSVITYKHKIILLIS